jgi:hypothetical protein
MSRDRGAAPFRRIVWRVIASALLAGFCTRAPLAQQPGLGGGGSAHAPAFGQHSGGGKRGLPLGLPSSRAAKQDALVQAPHFMKMVPAFPARSNADRNAIAVPVPPHNAVPVGTHVGPIAVPGSAPQSGGALAARGGVTAPMHIPGAQPLISSRAAIGGPSFTRPGTALAPLGGPANAAATGINGTSIRSKH